MVMIKLRVLHPDIALLNAIQLAHEMGGQLQQLDGRCFIAPTLQPGARPVVVFSKFRPAHQEAA